MCFSAAASFTVGIPLVAVGVFTIGKTERKAEVPAAAIPLLFGIQQIIEGVLWLTFRFDAPALNRLTTDVYSLFSHVLWPIFVPLAVLLLEAVPWRKRLMYGFQVMGLIAGGYLLYILLTEATIAQVVNRSIVYESPHFYILAVMALYFSATGVSSLVSSHRCIQLFGLLTLASAFLAYLVKALAFVSVWCFFAAILSSVIYFHFRRSSREFPADAMSSRSAFHTKVSAR